MSFEKLKGFKSYSSTVSEPVNPYTKKKTTVSESEPAGKMTEEDKLVLTNSLLEGQNSYLAARVFQQERDLKILREDIASLYAMIRGLGISEITETEAREIYYGEFRVDERHLRSRINKKIIDEEKNKIDNE